MKVGFDGKRAVRNMTGLGNYSRFVIEALGRSFPDDRFDVYVSGMVENERLCGIKELGNVGWRFPRGGVLGRGALWRSFGVSRELAADGVDLYHGLSNELPLNIGRFGVRSVVTIHDLIFRRLPGCYGLADRVLYDLKYGWSCRVADRVIAISECTKRDVMEFYGVAEERIDVVYQGCDDVFMGVCCEEELARVRAERGLEGRYVLQVGTIERRKNAELSVRVLAGVSEDVKLVLVGRRTAYAAEVLGLAEELGVAGRVVVMDDVRMCDLPALYQQAEVVMYPSRYEGFGIPVLEGLWSGRPVVAATGSCLEEAGGDAAFYVSPDDARGAAEVVRCVLEGGVDVASVAGRGRRHAGRFDNASVAGRIREVYERVLEGR